jgi:ribonucleotide reductase alpha subunit
MVLPKTISKRNGEIVNFDQNKIFNAILKAFRSFDGLKDFSNEAELITNNVLESINNNINLTIEQVQDFAEEALMKEGFYHIAKRYILYRNEHAQKREKTSLNQNIIKEENSLSGNVTTSGKINSYYFDHDVMREFTFYRTYSRWIPELSRRETWTETVDRYMNFMKENLGDLISIEELTEIRKSILHQDVMPSMRLLQFAGDPARRCNLCVYNCSFTAPKSLQDLSEIMYILMSGTGCGFSVEEQFVNQLPLIQEANNIIKEYTIEDSKEGWCQGFLFGLEIWYKGEDVIFDYSKIRPSGARLKTMGGRSSGPQPLINLMKFSKEIIQKRAGKKLLPINVHDIICKIGEIVVAGGTRRSALISLSDFSDNEMRGAKCGAFWNINSQRCLANNSAVYNEKPTEIEFMEEWLSLAKSGTGERGIFNRGDLSFVIPSRRLNYLQDVIKQVGTNPCVTGDTWVLTVDGPRQVFELLDKKTPLIVNGKIFQMESDGFFSTGEREVFSLKTKRGFTINATANHMFLKSENKWEELKNLKPGDFICVSRQNSVSWKGEGSYEEGVLLGKIIVENGINLDRKCSENSIERMSSSFNRGFIRGFFGSAEWSTWKSEIVDYDNLKIKVFTDTAVIVQRILSRFGIIATVQNDLIAFENDNLIKLLEMFEYSNEYKLINDSYNYPNNKIKSKKEETFADVIDSITLKGIESVYDVSVEKAHEFCGNGIRAHNCGEILLQPKSLCNLTEVVCRATDTEETLLRKIKIATILGTYQSTLCRFNYLSQDWKIHQEAERLLGVSLTGQADCSLLKNPSLLTKLKNYSIEINTEYSKNFNINPSVSITCTKPSGTVSVMVGASSGVHPRFSQYYIRRIRISATDPLLRLMRDQGYKCSPENGQVEGTANTYVLEFPCKSPEGAVCVNDVSAIEQLEYWKMIKENFTEHNPSVTIYIKDGEWFVVGQWILQNWKYITGLSFLPYSDHIYTLAPYEKITKNQYLELYNSLPTVDFSKLVYYEFSDTTAPQKEVCCSGDKCEFI